MKKILSLSFIFLILFSCNLSNASAKVLTWNEICDKFIENYGDSQSEDEEIYTITKTDNSLKIKLINEEINYEIVFNYTNGKITFNNNREDIDNNYTKIMNSFVDLIMIKELMYTISDLYNLNEDDLFILENSDAVIIVYGEKYEYKEETETYISSDEIESMTIDLTKVDELLTKKTNNSLENDNLKKASGNEIENQVSANQEINNPKTLDISNNNYLYFLGISVVGICILLINLVKNNKCHN